MFATNSGMQKYCSEECATAAKETKKKRQRDFLRAVEPIMELQQQEYLTFSKVAILLGCTRQYVYKLVEQGKLPASRLSSRMALIRRSDIERMFEANPYNRVLPCSKPKPSIGKKLKTFSMKEAKAEHTADEVLEYYSGEEVMHIYKVKQSWLYASAKRHQIPMCRIAGRNYYSKKPIADSLSKTQISSQAKSTSTSSDYQQVILIDGEQKQLSIPERVYKELDSNIVVPENSDATHEDILKVAMLLFLNYVDAATAMSESYGGGGDAGTGWEKDKDEDELERARRCVKMANWLCKPIVRRWKRGK